MKIKNTIAILSFVIAAMPVSAQPATESIKNINSKLRAGETTISNILSDPAFMSFHSLTPFREIIRQNAKAEKIKISTINEPGTAITVRGIILGASGKPLANNLVYVYQTSAEGWYSDTAPHILINEGDRRHARLFGYFRTGSKGDFELTTIKPNGYPNSSLPAHIHIEILLNSDRNFITELLFDDDPRLVGDIRTRSVAERFIISKNTGTNTEPVYSYTIRTPG